MDEQLRTRLIAMVAEVIDTHRVLEEGTPYKADCSRCSCEWVRESVTGTGTYRWHVAAAVVDALHIEQAGRATRDGFLYEMRAGVGEVPVFRIGAVEAD